MADGKNQTPSVSDRLIIFNQPKWKQEQRALVQLIDILDQTPDIGDYRIFVGYYVLEHGQRSFETDAVLICRQGVAILELKDYYGLTKMTSATHKWIYRSLPGSPVDRREDNPSSAVRDRCRAMPEVLRNNGLPAWPVLGLLLFTHPKGELQIGERSTVSSLASADLGVGGLADVPQLLKLTSRNLAGPGKTPRLLTDADIKRVSDVLSRGARHIEDRFPFQIREYVVEAVVSPFEEIGTDVPVNYHLYRGHEQFTEAPVLIKEMEAGAKEYLGNPEGSSESLMHGAMALRSLSEQHPNIVQLLTTHVPENYEKVYQIYRLEEATPLYGWIEAPIRLRLHLLAQAAEALAFVHGNGMLHRSVNPFNILVTGAGDKAKLFNFDLARVVGQPTRYLEAQKQPLARYVADELKGARSREDINWQCDSFSFGYTAFEVLSGGKAPFDNPDSHGDQRNLLDYADVSDELARLIDLSLSVRPTERPPLAELAAALRDEEGLHAAAQ